jgi:hypothetical protein
MADRKVVISLFGDDRDLDTKIRDAKAKLDELVAKAKDVRLGADDKDLQVKIQAAKLKLDELSKKKVDPSVDLKGYEKTSLEIDKLDLKLDKLDAKMLGSELEGGGSSFTQLGSSLGALSNFGIPALIAGLVALSGQAAVVTFGLGGLGLAAFKDIDPIVKAAQKTGGLEANLGKLDATQRQAAYSLLGLNQDYAKFTNNLKPEVLGSFNQALHIGADLLTQTEPVAKAAGKALEGVLTGVDAEFKSGTWQQFFGFMEKEAGPDVKQLGTLFTDLLNAIPPVAEALHPLGSALINDIDDVVKLTGGVAKLSLGLESLSSKLNSIQNFSGAGSKLATGNGLLSQFSGLTNLFKNFPSQINPALGPAEKLVQWVENLGKAGGDAGKGQNLMAQGERQAAQAAAQEQKALQATATAIGNVSNKILALQGSDVGWRQAQDAANQALKQVNGSLDKNSQNALAAKQALIASSQAAIQFAQNEVTLHGNMQKANQILNSQIQYLAIHAGKSRFAQQEILALVQAEYKIPGHVSSAIHVNSAAAAAAIANIENRLAALNGQTSTVYVDYSVGGTSYVVPHHRKAAGGLIPGTGNSDTYPALLTPGEAVVPKRLVPYVAPFLSANNVPGFNLGGIMQPDSGLPNFPRAIQGNTYNISVNAGPLSSPADIGRQVVYYIRKFEQGNGKSWRH